MGEKDRKGKEKREENMLKLFIEIPLEIAYTRSVACESERDREGYIARV